MPPQPKRIFLKQEDLAKFLTDAEATGFGLQDVDVVKICNENTSHHGTKGSDRRIGFLQKFNQLRRGGIKNYRK